MENLKITLDIYKASDILTKLDQHIYILLQGDFNLSNRKWIEGQILYRMSPHDQKYVVITISTMPFVEQFINKPARAKQNLCPLLHIMWTISLM